MAKNSDMLSLRTCVPQGNILGPLLFIIYINDITKDSKFIINADDTTTLSTTLEIIIRNTQNLTAVVYKDMKQIYLGLLIHMNQCYILM